MAYPPSPQTEEFLDDNGNPVTLDDSGNIVSSQPIQALDDSGDIISSAKEFAGGIKDVGRGLLELFNPIGEPTKGDPLSEYLGFSLQNPARRVAEGMIESSKGTVTDIGKGDYPRAAAGVADIVGLPATGVLDLAREGNYSRAAGVGVAGLGLAYGGVKAGKGVKIKPKTPKYLEMIPEGTKTIELLEPTSRVESPPVKLLPEGVDPFIVGVEGRAQRRSLLTPQEEARLTGYDIDAEGRPVGAKGESGGTSVSIEELREAARQRALSYTDRDLQGGTPLVIEAKPNVEIPASRWSERQSFEPFAQQENLEYPLNVVPSAVTPRRTQTVMEGLVPERFNEPIPLETELKPVSAKPERILPEVESRKVLGGTAAIEPGEPILPSAIRRVKQEVKDNTGLNINPVNPIKNVDPSIPKPIKEAVKQGVQKLQQEAQHPSILLKGAYEQLARTGPAGKELVFKFQRAAQKRAEYDAVWTEPLFKIGSKLSKEEFANFGAYVEGRKPIPNQRVKLAVDEWNRAQDMMGTAAEQSKLHMLRGDDVIPFQKISKGYWPRIPQEGLTKKDIITKLMDKGITRREAELVAKRWQNTGEIFLGSQHSRLKDIFPYRDDFDMAIHHGRSMAKRIANHEELGPKDIAGKGDQGIANLIEDTSDPSLTMKLAKRLAGREELPNEKLVNGLNQARKWMSLTSLPNFTFPNIALGQAMNTHMAILSRHPLKAAAEVSKLIKSSYRDEIRSSGVFNSFNRTLLEELSGIDPFKIGAGEKINRSVAAAVGRSTVREAFTDYKAGKNVRSARYFLETLLARDPDTITAITPELERFAAGRMAEITQGLNNPGNLPYGWSNPINSYGAVATQLMLIFKKVGFQTTKTVKDSIKANPVLGTASWLAISQVAGEMVGDIKSGLTGKERPEELINRIADNWGNAFMLGLPWELVTSAQYGPSGALGTVFGPAASKGSELMYDIYATGDRLINDKEDPFGPIRRFGLKNLPIPGRERIKSAVEEQ